MMMPPFQEQKCRLHSRHNKKVHKVYRREDDMSHSKCRKGVVKGNVSHKETWACMEKKKNVTLTEHGSMARLDRTVRTLRWWCMFLI